jgi:hypothetical protein
VTHVDSVKFTTFDVVLLNDSYWISHDKKMKNEK